MRGLVPNVKHKNCTEKQPGKTEPSMPMRTGCSDMGRFYTGLG
jgi:hypothetical protein